MVALADGDAVADAAALRGRVTDGHAASDRYGLSTERADEDADERAFAAADADESNVAAGGAMTEERAGYYYTNSTHEGAVMLGERVMQLEAAVKSLVRRLAEVEWKISLIDGQDDESSTTDV
ncbi:MAG: hypothetical protein PVJ86_05400 [Phycisphaerales bacterium]